MLLELARFIPLHLNLQRGSLGKHVSKPEGLSRKNASCCFRPLVCCFRPLVGRSLLLLLLPRCCLQLPSSCGRFGGSAKVAV